MTVPKLKLILMGMDFVDAVWRKSSFSGGGGCVEVAMVDDVVAVRDSKDRPFAVLTFRRDKWDAFIAGVQDGEFDMDWG